MKSYLRGHQTCLKLTNKYYVPLHYEEFTNSNAACSKVLAFHLWSRHWKHVESIWYNYLEYDNEYNSFPRLESAREIFNEAIRDDDLEKQYSAMRELQIDIEIKKRVIVEVIYTSFTETVRKRAEKKRDKIEGQIRDLRALQDTLTQLINACHSGKGKQKCPIVETLLEKDI